MKTEKKRKFAKTTATRNPNLWELRTECWNNSIGLLKESCLLFENGYYARAFLLAYTAMEEVGKYLVVCDFINDIVSMQEFKKVFKDHGLKTAYFHNSVRMDTNKGWASFLMSADLTIEYDDKGFEDLIKLRNRSAYVGLGQSLQPIAPCKSIDKDTADSMIKKVSKEISLIDFSEDLNGRIGSKAIYK